MNGYIIAENANDVFYAYYHRRFWRWDDARSVWKESHLMTQKYERGKAALATLTPEAFLTNSTEFTQPDEYELDTTMLDALKAAKPCKTVPIEPVKEESDCTAMNSAAPSENADDSSAIGGVHSSTGTGSMTELVHSAPPDKPLTFIPENKTPEFDYSGLDKQTVEDLHFAEDEYRHGKKLAERGLVHMGDAIAIAHDALCGTVVQQLDNGQFAKKDDTFRAWCCSIGITKSSAYNLLQVSALMEGSSPRQKAVLESLPPTLLYAVARPSAPEELVEKVKNGDITTNKQYQELLAQLKAEKERSAAAEAREEEVWKMHEEARKRAETAESRYEAALADVNNLAEANQQKNKELEAARKDLRAAKECYSVAKKNEAFQCEHIKTLQEENAALKKQPIAAVVDKEEVERQAREMAAEMTADLRAQLEQASSGSEQDARNAYDSILRTGRSIENIWQTVKPLFRKMPAEQREDAANHLVHTLATIQGEVSKCL